MNFHPLHAFRVMVMHPDPILSAGLVAALGRHPSFDVLAQAPDGSRIDVVLTDYGNAMRLTDAQGRRDSGIPVHARILAITGNDREADIRRAIEAGVHGYVLAGGSLDELLDAVTSVASGLRYTSAAVAQRMADSLARARLTSREMEILGLVANGDANKVIARALGIELTTVKSHVSTIMVKLGASSRTQAARIAASRGLIASAQQAHPERRPRQAANDMTATFTNRARKGMPCSSPSP